MSRLVFVHGPWQLLIAASALKQASQSDSRRYRDTLVIFALHDGPIPRPLAETIARIAAVVWPWDRVVTLESAHPWNIGDARSSIETLRASLPATSPEEVWLDCLWGAPEKIAAEAFPKARLVLYEDGLQTYLPGDHSHQGLVRMLRDPRAAYRAVRLRVRERRKPEDLSLATMLPRHLGRVASSYLWMSLIIPPPEHQRSLPWVQLQTSIVKETITRVSPLVDGFGEKPNGKRALVMGQCFSNYGDLSRSDELNCYIEMATRLEDMGYEVLWKEHPRTRQPFQPDLVEAVPDLQSAPDWGPWPAELFVERLGLSACAAISSTSLFSMRLLFGLESFSPAARFLPLLHFPNDALAGLAARWIAPLGPPGTISSTAHPGAMTLPGGAAPASTLCEAP